MAQGPVSTRVGDRLGRPLGAVSFVLFLDSLNYTHLASDKLSGLNRETKRLQEIVFRLLQNLKET